MLVRASYGMLQSWQRPTLRRVALELPLEVFMKILLLAASLVFAQTPAQTPVIRSLMYEGFKGIASDEIARRFKDRGIRVAVEEMYDPAQVDSARTVLQELLTEKGRKGVEVRHLPPRSIEVIFQAVAK
jgi:hypothetical protein